MNSLISSSRLYGILDTGYVRAENMADVARQLLQGGVKILQLRAKKSSLEEIIAMAQQLLPLVRAAGGLFFINDYPQLVPIIGADGAHIGQDDVSVAEARRLAGKRALIGLSTHSLDQVQKALTEQPDYIGFGPLFPTPTKPDYHSIGLSDIRKAQESVPFPVFCIGGITSETLPQVLAAGAERVVIVSHLLTAEDRSEKVQKIVALLDSRGRFFSERVS